MRIIEPKVEIIEQNPGLEGINKMVERAARICYKSEHLIKEGSAENLIGRLKEWKHYTPFEHGTVYLKVPMSIVTCDLAESSWELLSKNPYTFSTCDSDFYYYTTNMRVILEHNLEDSLQYLSEPTQYHEKRVSVIFTCSRAIAQEFTRHRLFSFNMESQRYCNYSKDKFFKEVTFIKPIWMPKEDVHYYEDNGYLPIGTTSGIWTYSMENSERMYFNLLDKGLKPEEAREVLSNSCKTELMMTGAVSQWQDFFNQRCSPKAHPEAQLLVNELRDRFLVRGLICG